jgi:single-stranded-DNA-specific exonuclease
MVNNNKFTKKQGAKYLWLLPESNREQTLALAASYSLSCPIVETLVGRGLCSKEALDAYLFSVCDQERLHPSHFADALKAVERIRRALDTGEKILIFGDYDVDGMSATALMLFCLLKVGAHANFYLPQRSIDGYGLSASAVRKAVHNGYSLIITVDNGITAFAAANAAQECGVDLIITDHHRPHDVLPVAYAVVNPQRSDCPYPCKVLAGVGVAFKLMMLLYEDLKLRLPDKVYELLTLGTIADVVPLVDENRYWVRQGLALMNRAPSLPLTVLKQQSKIERELISSLDIGFSLAPQLNALGRLSDPRKAIGFLIGSDAAMVHEVGQTLFELNEVRKETERAIFNDVEAAIIDKRIDLSKEKVIIAAHRSWQAGVIGLVAARLVNAYGRPTLLFHCTADGKATGSGRSIPAFNLFNALEASADLIDHYGGHAGAAGLSLSIEQLPRLKERLESLVAEQLTPYDLQQKITIDAHLAMSELTTQLVSDLKHLEPFGRENDQPIFYIKNVSQLQKPQLLKDLHVKTLIFAEGVIKPIIFFNRPELFPWLLELGSEPFDCAAHVVENSWQGRTNIELQGVDVAKAES